MRQNRGFSIGSFFALAAAGYALYTNRFRIQRFLESQGIDTPWMKGSLSDAVRSGAAKLTGAVDSASKGNINAASQIA